MDGFKEALQAIIDEEARVVGNELTYNIGREVGIEIDRNGNVIAYSDGDEEVLNRLMSELERRWGSMSKRRADQALGPVGEKYPEVRKYLVLKRFWGGD